MILLVYHSQSGACAKLAAAVKEGASKACHVTVKRACDTEAQDLWRAGAVLFVAAENSGSLAGEMKALLDRSLYPYLDQAALIPAALLVSAGNDGRGAAAQFERIAKGFPFKLMNQTEILRGDPQPDQLEFARAWGEALAEGVNMGIF